MIVNEISIALFERLTDSAIKFFGRSISTFDAEIDASIIHFATALELILKAQLAREHWAFIFDEMGSINMESLNSGRFTSVPASDLVKRINSILAFEIKEQESSSYKDVFKHRNKVIHYIHGELSNEDECKKIKLTFLSSWYYLHRRLNEKFIHDFDLKKKRKIGVIFDKMSEKEGFWDVVYADKQPLIKAKKEKGYRIRQCVRCKKKSVLTTEEGRSCGIFLDISLNCVVCGLRDTFVACKCPNCDKYVELNSDDVFCKSCGHEIVGENRLATIEICDHDYEDIGCGDCGSEKIYAINGSYYCASCLETHDDYFSCDYCGALQTGEIPEDCFLDGCQFCDGKMGELASKDD